MRRTSFFSSIFSKPSTTDDTTLNSPEHIEKSPNVFTTLQSSSGYNSQNVFPDSHHHNYPDNTSSYHAHRIEEETSDGEERVSYDVIGESTSRRNHNSKPLDDVIRNNPGETEDEDSDDIGRLDTWELFEEELQNERMHIMEGYLGARKRKITEGSNDGNNCEASTRILKKMRNKRCRSVKALFIVLLGMFAGVPRENKVNLWAGLITKYFFYLAFTVQVAVYTLFLVFNNDYYGDLTERSNLFHLATDVISLLVRISMSLYCHSQICLLVKDGVMLKILVKFFKFSNPLPMLAFLLNLSEGVSIIIINTQEQYMRKTDWSSFVAELLPYMALGVDVMTTLLGTLFNTILIMLLTSWCSYLSHEIKSYCKDLDEDAVVCEYNFFLEAAKRKKISHFSLSNSVHHSMMSHSFHHDGGDRSYGSRAENGFHDHELGHSCAVVSKSAAQLETISNDEILLMYTHMKERLVYTSRRFQFWLAMCFVSSAFMVVRFIYQFIQDSSSVLYVIYEISVVLWFPVMTQSILRVNSQLHYLPKHIYPLPSRNCVFTLIAAARAEFCIYGAPLTYSSIFALCITVAIGLLTRLMVAL